MFVPKAVKPSAEFLVPVVLELIAGAPTAVLYEPVVLAFKAAPCASVAPPKAALSIPVVLACKDWEPKAVILPVVFAAPAFQPTAVLWA